jgi:hypothetical protein
MLYLLQTGADVSSCIAHAIDFVLFACSVVLSLWAGVARAVVLWVDLHLDTTTTISGSPATAVSLARHALYVLPSLGPQLRPTSDSSTSTAAVAAGQDGLLLNWETGITASQLKIRCQVQQRALD